MSTNPLLAALKEIERDADWLLCADRFWGHWWNASASDEQRDEISAYVRDQAALVADVRRWAGERWPSHPHVGDGLLYLLATKEPFTTECDSAALRREVAGHISTAVYGVSVTETEAGLRPDIWQMFVWLLPRLQADSGRTLARQINFIPYNESALDALTNNVNGLKAALNGLTGWRFLCWFLWEGWKRSRWERWVIWLACGAALALLVLLLALPEWLLLEDGVLTTAARTFITVTVVACAVFVRAYVRQRRAARALLCGTTVMRRITTTRSTSRRPHGRRPATNSGSTSSSLRVRTTLSASTCRRQRPRRRTLSPGGPTVSSV